MTIQEQVKAGFKEAVGNLNEFLRPAKLGELEAELGAARVHIAELEAKLEDVNARYLLASAGLEEKTKELETLQTKLAEAEENINRRVNIMVQEKAASQGIPAPVPEEITSSAGHSIEVKATALEEYEHIKQTGSPADRVRFWRKNKEALIAQARRK